MKTLKDQNGENLETGNKDILDTEFSLKSKSKNLELECLHLDEGHFYFGAHKKNSHRLILFGIYKHVFAPIKPSQHLIRSGS